MILEVIITVAMVMYFMAYFIAKSNTSGWWTHIPVAIAAFILDMYATFLMWEGDFTNASWVVIVHTGLTLIAIALFFVQGYLGIMRKREAHIFFAKRVFLPAWVISYSSGFLFFII